MKKLTLVSLMVLASTSVFASNPDVAYRQSATHAGGPAGLLISSTGGPVASRRPFRLDPAYARSGSHAGGPADLLISSTGGPVLHRARAYRDPAYAYSGSHAGGPAALLNTQTGRYQ
jgi:hypothetical protein